MQQTSVRGHRDFRRLWVASAISQSGSAIGMVALPVVAVIVLEATAFQVSLLAAVTAVATALVAFPVGNLVEFRPKRPLMIATNLSRCFSLLSIPGAALAGVLTFEHLCVVSAINAVCVIAFSAAAQAHLKNLVSPERLVDANSRLESTRWMTVAVGPSIGGVLIGVLTAFGGLAINAAAFVVSAISIRLIRAPEPPPPVRSAEMPWYNGLWEGVGFVWRHNTLRRILASWLLFAGASSMAWPLSSVFYLRDLGFELWQYGLLMGVPSVGGVAGAWLTPKLVARLGPVRALWWASILRGPWYFLIPLAVPGPVGLLMCGLGFGAVLFFAGLANSGMVSYRQLQTPDDLMARVATLWQFATTVTQPLFILAGGLLVAWLDVRTGLVIAATLMTAAAFVLPRRNPPVSTPREGTSSAGTLAQRASRDHHR